MCGRLVWVFDSALKRWVRRYDNEAEKDPSRLHVLDKRRHNVPPASHLPVLGRDRRIHVARWGFPITKRPNGVFNTRVETMAESPMWRAMLGRSHCVWAANGFYEWVRDGNRRTTPYYIHRADGEPLLMAGFMQERRVGEEVKPCASILTCAPNEFMMEIHDRMPVILEDRDVATWLDATREEVFDVVGPAGDVLVKHQVTPDVGDTKNDDARLMQPVEDTGLGAFT